MFAMLKFQNRGGSTAFSQAFILTISLKDHEILDEQFISTITAADSNSCNDCHSSPRPCTNSSHHVSETSADRNDSTRLYPFPNIENTTTGTIDSVSIGLKNITDIDLNGPESLKEVLTEQRSESGMQRGDIRLSLPSETKTYDDLTNAVVGLCNESPQAADNLQNSNWCEYLSESIDTSVEKAGGEERIERIVTGSEPIIPRSSDITDQVMEGLMFTIKQDKDNIKVVEQQTKMELDEVLENSEKIETKGGEKCLVNSSLLGLENLLTKIEVPIKQVKNNTTTNSTVKINERISSASTLVRDQDGIFTAGFSLSSQPREQEQIAIPIPPSNRIPVLSSLESNGNDNVFDKLFPPTNGSVQNQSPKTKLFRLSGDKDVIRRFHQNVIERKRRKLVLGKINSKVNRQPKDIEKREIVDNRGNVSNGCTKKKNSCADDDVGHDNNDDNNNNNNSNNDSNGTSNIIADEVQIDMWKLLQDIARGVKVMVERISDTDIKNATKSQTISTSATGTSMARRVPTRSTK